MKLQQTIQEVPEHVGSRVDKTLTSLRKKRFPARKVAYGAAAACVAITCLAGANFLYPGMVQALKDVPVIGSVFKLLGDVGARLSSETGLSTKVNETAEDQGIKMTITEVMYDGIRLYVGYVIDSERDLRPSQGELYVNGKQVNSSAGGNNKKVGQLHAGVFSYGLNQPLPDRFNLKIEYHGMMDMSIQSDGNLKEIKGSWSFNLPVKKLQEGITVKSFANAPKVQSQERSLAVEKVTFTPAETVIDLETVEPFTFKTPEQQMKEYEIEKQKMQFVREGFQVFDNHGIMLKTLSSGGSQYTVSSKDVVLRTKPQIQLAPVQSVPDYLIIRPYSVTYSTDPNKKPVYVEATLDESKLPIVLPQGRVGKITITKVEFLQDRTLLHYLVEGEDPYEQADSLSIVSSSGQHWEKETPELIQVNNLTYSFITEYPPIDKHQELKFVTAEIQIPEVAKELELKVPLK